MTFYDHDQELVEVLARFVSEGIDATDRVIVLATPEHRAALEAALVAGGLDPDEPPAAGHLVILDAQATLNTFLGDQGPEDDRFFGVMGQLITDAAADGSRVRVYGEMVTLLWHANDVAGAIILESLWNDLIERASFSLLCGYPAAVLDGSRLGELHEVCLLHSSVLPPLSHTLGSDPGDTQSRVFLPVPESVAAARRFVTDTLGQWKLKRAVHDAALIASELATNAVIHAGSPFRVTVDRSAGMVCLAFHDVGDGRAERDPDDLELQHNGRAEAPNGRGMSIVEALSRRWGCDSLPGGKVVWAELAV